MTDTSTRRSSFVAHGYSANWNRTRRNSFVAHGYSANWNRTRQLHDRKNVATGYRLTPR